MFGLMRAFIVFLWHRGRLLDHRGLALSRPLRPLLRRHLLLRQETTSEKDTSDTFTDRQFFLLEIGKRPSSVRQDGQRRRSQRQIGPEWRPLLRGQK